jgi:hypothetical protein
MTKKAARKYTKSERIEMKTRQRAKRIARIASENPKGVIDPKGEQPIYVRGKHTFATSPKLIRFRACMARLMEAGSYTDRKSVRDAFSKNADTCSKEVA